MCRNSLACIISLINVYNHLHSEVSQICFEGGVAKTLYIPYKLILIGGVANQNNFATPPKYLRHLLTMQLKSRVKTNLRHFPTICQLYTLRDTFTGKQNSGIFEKIPIFSHFQNFSRHFKIPEINFTVIGVKCQKGYIDYRDQSVKLCRCFVWSLSQRDKNAHF